MNYTKQPNSKTHYGIPLLLYCKSCAKEQKSFQCTFIIENHHAFKSTTSKCLFLYKKKYYFIHLNVSVKHLNYDNIISQLNFVKDEIIFM